MAEHVAPPTGSSPSGPPVTDHRPVPRGVLPRGVQTWVMTGLAVGMLAIMLIVGRPQAPVRPGTPTVQQSPATDRVREYQDRLRALEAQALADAQAASSAPNQLPVRDEYELQSPPPPDPIETEKKKREYDSLFASNVVLSRRPDADRPDPQRPPSREPVAAETDAAASAPSVDDIADAVLRATSRAGVPPSPPTATETAHAPQPTGMDAATTTQSMALSRTPESTDPISAAGPLHRILEGTIIDTVLTNRLDGGATAPVNCLVTNAVYSQSGRDILIPAGARVLGETKPVQTFGETRLAVAFHRLVLPDGRTYRLDQFVGLNQIGDTGLRDRVNQHYLATFGAAAAVGLVSGLAQFLGTAGIGDGAGDRTIVIAGGVGDASAQATLQVMNRFLNRLPTVTIREGHRVKVYLTSDLELPAYIPPRLLRPSGGESLP
jgi:type IV secretory pathway VirB10-like protein